MGALYNIEDDITDLWVFGLYTIVSVNMFIQITLDEDQFYL